MRNFFSIGKPIYLTGYKDEMNVSSLFCVDFNFSKKAELLITGNSDYQIFLNGFLINYGPARAATNYYRVDRLSLKNLIKHNRLIIILDGYNCNSFNHPFSAPFIQFELKTEEKIICYSCLETKAFLFTERLRKVVRFSYQREFSESYKITSHNYFKYGENIPFVQIKCFETMSKKLLPRLVSYPILKNISFNKVETGIIFINSKLKIYEDRYMSCSMLKIFPRNTWDVDPNKEVSLFDYSLATIKTTMTDMTFATFAYSSDKTGFMTLNLNVKKKSSLYLVFDEIDINDCHDKPIRINFYRNTTHNIISYQLEKGKYSLVSFEPYTAKYIRVIVQSGEIDLPEVGMIPYENKYTSKFVFESQNKMIEAVVKAGISTLSQNSVDILTDCPSRERAGWLCDSFFSARAEKLITGTNKAERSFLENYSLYQGFDLPSKMIPMCYPGDFPDGTYIPNWAMFYVLELKDYYLRNGNRKLIKKSLDKVKNLIWFFKKYENEYGLLENLESWVFVEWSHENDLESIQGVNFPSNMLYAQMLEDASFLLKDKRLELKAIKIRKTINRLGFNGKFYVDNAIRDENNTLVPTQRIGETTQYYAFYFNLADKKTRPNLFKTLLNDFGPLRNDKKVFPKVYRSNVFIGDYLRLEILLKERLGEKICSETISYFSKMASLTGTLWEHDSPFASLNHGFASFIVNIIVSVLTGLERIDYINKIISIYKPSVCEKFKVKIPLENGYIIAKSDGNKIEYNIKGPYIIKKQ